VKNGYTALVLSLTLSIGTGSAFAKAGSLDPTFGSDGIVETNFGANTNNFQFVDAVLAPNGDIVVAGYVFNLTEEEGETPVLLRYLPSGAVDPSFGTDGVVTLPATTGFADSNVSSSGVLAVQANGDVLVLTIPEVNGAFVLAMQRFTVSGQPDTTFGSDGLVVTNFPAPSGFSADPSMLLAQPDGKILLAGTAFPPFKSKLPQHTVLGRYLASGALDTSFGSAGFTSVVSIGTPTPLGLISGDGILTVNDEGQLAQFSSSGALLSTPVGGTVVAITQSQQTNPSTFQTNGKYLVESGTQGPFGRRNVLAAVSRFLVSGAVDTTFVAAPISFGPDTTVVSSGVGNIVVDASGRILVGGTFSTLSPASSEFGLARLQSNGSLDTTFGTGGTVTTTVGTLSGIGKLLLQSNGSIVAVGVTHVTTGSTTEDLAIARYLAQ
jgi:uncharacterized delta-60 repeat protein